MQFSLEQQKILPPRQRVGILEIDAQLNCIKTKWIFIKSHHFSLERSHAILIKVNYVF